MCAQIYVYELIFVEFIEIYLDLKIFLKEK